MTSFSLLQHPFHMIYNGTRHFGVWILSQSCSQSYWHFPFLPLNTKFSAMTNVPTAPDTPCYSPVPSGKHMSQWMRIEPADGSCRYWTQHWILHFLFLHTSHTEGTSYCMRAKNWRGKARPTVLSDGWRPEWETLVLYLVAGVDKIYLISDQNPLCTTNLHCYCTWPWEGTK